MNKKIIIGIIGILVILNIEFIFSAGTGIGGELEIIQPELTIDYRENNTGYIKYPDGTIQDIYTKLTFRKNYYYFDFLENNTFSQNQVIQNNYFTYFNNNFFNQIGDDFIYAIRE